MSESNTHFGYFSPHFSTASMSWFLFLLSYFFQTKFRRSSGVLVILQLAVLHLCAPTAPSCVSPPKLYMKNRCFNVWSFTFRQNTALGQSWSEFCPVANWHAGFGGWVISLFLPGGVLHNHSGCAGGERVKFKLCLLSQWRSPLQRLGGSSRQRRLSCRFLAAEFSQPKRDGFKKQLKIKRRSWTEINLQSYLIYCFCKSNGFTVVWLFTLINRIMNVKKNPFWSTADHIIVVLIRFNSASNLSVPLSFDIQMIPFDYIKTMF